MNDWTTCTVIFIVIATGSVRFLPVHVTATCSLDIEAYNIMFHA